MPVKFTAQARTLAIAATLILIAVSTIARASAASVVSTGALNISRTEHTASVLPNGSVLIAGGRSMAQYGALAAVATAEIYNPASGTFSPTGSMMFPRNSHAAATLANGNVLVMGGNTSTAELFNPASGAWMPTGSMMYARTGAQAVALKDGRVLVIGDQSIGAAAGTCEIYDPSTGRFSLSGNLPAPRIGASALLLSDGRVILAGGGTAGTPYGGTTPVYADQASMIWNPATGLWSWGPALAAQHMYGTATLLPNGKVLLAGGTDATNQATVNAEVLDPAAGWSSPTGSMGVPRQVAAASVQSDGTVLVAGGLTNSPAGPIMTASLESYSPATGTWQSLGNMTSSRFNFTASLLGNGNMLLAGGATVNAATNQFSVLQAVDLLKSDSSPSCASGALSIPVASIAIGMNGMSGPFPVNAAPTCTWKASTNAAWITLANATGTGNGSFSMTIAPNPMLARTGVITINGSTTLQINEAGQAQTCSPQVNSVAPGVGANFGYAGGNGAISVNANYGCGWQVTGAPSWVALTSATQGNGPGSVTYSVAPSNGPHRAATLQIGQYSYTITQN